MWHPPCSIVRTRVDQLRRPPPDLPRGRRLDVFESVFLPDLVRLHSLQYTGRSVSGRKGSSSMGFPHPAHLRSNTRTSCIFRLDAILPPRGTVSTTPSAVDQTEKSLHLTRSSAEKKAAALPRGDGQWRSSSLQRFPLSFTVWVGYDPAIAAALSGGR